jgi:hypothetical protein
MSDDADFGRKKNGVSLSAADPDAPFGRRKDGTPKLPNRGQLRNLERGYRSSGVKASGIPAGGEGWGGSANGGGTPFTPGDPNIATLMRRADPEGYKARVAAKKARGEALVDHMEHLAFNAENEQTQLAAAIAGANRLLGPVPTKLIGGDEEEGEAPIQFSDRDRAKALAALLAKARIGRTENE